MAMRLRTLLGDHPQTAALKSGAIKSDLIELEFVEYSPTNKGFKPMVREQAFDVSEMAIVTYLMAKSFNKPMVLLPNVVMARFQHGFAVYSPTPGELKPADLAGKRVGIRSFTTTTGAWLRGILANDYGVDLNAIDWVTFEDPHVAEFRDTTTRAPAGKQILQMLFDGELDAVLGEKCDDPRVRPLFPDLPAAEQAWFAKQQIVPVNHMVVVSSRLSKEHPDLVRELWRMLNASKEAAPVADKFGLDPYGSDNMTRSLQLISGYAAEQGLIPAEISVAEMFDDVTRALEPKP
jgi:4,5-dihydroxyphthalate decarboxylase